MAWWLKSERHIVYSAHWVVSNYIPYGFYPDTLKWHFPLCCANWTEEARIKQRVAYGFSSLLVVLEIYLSPRALELGKSWTANIMDTCNEEDCYPISCPTEYWFCNWSVIMVWLQCRVCIQTSIFLARILIFIAIASRVWHWDSILIMQPSTTLVLAAVHFRNCTHLNSYHFSVDVPGCGFRWHVVMCKKLCAIASEDSIVDSRRQARNYKQWAGVWPILDILLRNAKSSNFAYVFGAGCCSRIQAN